MPQALPYCQRHGRKHPSYVIAHVAKSRRSASPSTDDRPKLSPLTWMTLDSSKNSTKQILNDCSTRWCPVRTVDPLRMRSSLLTPGDEMQGYVPQVLLCRYVCWGPETNSSKVRHPERSLSGGHGEARDSSVAVAHKILLPILLLILLPARLCLQIGSTLKSFEISWQCKRG